MPLKFDIQNENFDYYFLDQTAQMTEAQKNKLPLELLHRIYKARRMKNMSWKLTFLEKLYALSKALDKRWVLLIEGDKNFMSVEDFVKYKELTDQKNASKEIAEQLDKDGIFALGPTELLDTFHKLNIVSIRAAYNYLMKVKNKNYLQPDEYKRNMNYLNRFLNNYEAQRKRITLETGLTMPEWLIMTFLYDGEEKVCSVLHKEKFRHSFNTSATKIKLAFGILQRKGYILKIGTRATSKFQITAAGRQKINMIAEKYIVNC